MDPHSFKISTSEWVHLEHVSLMSQLKGLKKGGSVKYRLRTIVQIGMNNMVGQSCSCSSVAIYLLLCVIFSTPFIRRATYGSQTGQPSVFGSWKMHNSSEFNFSFSQTTKLSHIPTSRMAASLKFVLATWLINATSTLAANLILLK